MNRSGVTVVIVGVGVSTAIGRSAPATAAAVRAGIAGFSRHPFMVDTAGNRMVVALAPWVDIGLSWMERLAVLARPAVSEAIAPLASALHGGPMVPVFIGLPPARPGRAQHLGAVADRVQGDVGDFGLGRAQPVMIEAGHAAGAMAVQAAWEAVCSGAVEFALAGGIDSYAEPDTLEWLEANDQLHSAGPDNNPYGFIPGEAAGFVLLANAVAAERYRLPASLELLSAVTSRETRLIKTDTVCLGQGLTALFQRLTGEPCTFPADYMYCDMNGEPYRADEFGFATSRATGLFRDPADFVAPSDCWGDVGAASGPLFVALADAAARKGYAKGPQGVIWTSSESGERCGAVLRAATRGTGEVR